MRVSCPECGKSLKGYFIVNSKQRCAGCERLLNCSVTRFGLLLQGVATALFFGVILITPSYLSIEMRELVWPFILIVLIMALVYTIIERYSPGQYTVEVTDEET